MLKHESQDFALLSEKKDISSTEKIDFDERIRLFQMLSKSVIFNHQDIHSEDIEYWFPECSNSSRESDIPISKNKINNSLECVLAQFMEDDTDFI